MAPVFGLSHFSRRLVESVVGLFAILGFLYVPLGRHTGFEHAKAIFSTPAASDAIDDLTRTALDLRQRAMAFVTGSLTTTPGGNTSEAPAKATPPSNEPRPVPPKLR